MWLNFSRIKLKLRTICLYGGKNMKTDNLKNNEKGIIMRSNFRRWKLDSLDEAGYFIIFQGFMESGMLNKISGNALKLYIYLGINSNNFEGIVWHSNFRIAKYFDKSERTIRTWMKELEDFHLIKRMQLKYDGTAYTYLQPYQAKYESKNNEELIEGIVTITKQNSLIIQIDNQTWPISSGTSIFIYDEYAAKWVEGKIIINRLPEVDEYSSNITYIFKPRYVNTYKPINISYGKVFKARIRL